MGDPIIPKGIANVTCENITKPLTLYVIENGSRRILGRVWLSELSMKIDSSILNNNKFDDTVVSLTVPVKNLIPKHLSHLLLKYPNVFADQLGTYTKS